ncbi:MAG: NifB/NifX family molybdenum-iron cluster-binding protein [Pseudomonadota bacterium]
MKTVVAFPSSQPGGLDAALGAHFGHCDLYTVITLEDETISDVKLLPNVPHQQGGCLAPVQFLAQNGVQVLVAGGMGLRPLMGFNQVGIAVYYGGGHASVSAAATALAQGQLPRFSQDFTCGGGGH